MVFIPCWHRVAKKVCGIDVSAYTARAVSKKYPDIAACAADIRRLPFADSSFDTIVSLSTADHFADPADIVRSIEELQRVLRPGGNARDYDGQSLQSPHSTSEFSAVFRFASHRAGIVSFGTNVYVWTCSRVRRIGRFRSARMRRLDARTQSDRDSGDRACFKARKQRHDETTQKRSHVDGKISGKHSRAPSRSFRCDTRHQAR
jgi:ubiquinone/menaquinone biosynthesis C-methylase UbiE